MIEKYLVKRVEALGGQCVKLKFINRRGAPDRVVLLPGRHLLIELKTTGLKAEAHQLREHERLRAAGFEVYVIDSFEKVDEVLL